MKFCSHILSNLTDINRLWKEWSYTFTPQYAFMALCSVKKAKQEQLYIYFYLLF